mgnify:CR=1 FL=1
MKNKVALGLFEDVDYDLLSPLSYLRPVYELKTGMFSNRERLERIFVDYKYCLFSRDFLSGLLKWRLNIVMGKTNVYVNELIKGYDILLINGRILLNESLIESLRELVEVAGNVVGLHNSNIVVLRLTSSVAEKFKSVLIKPFHLELLGDLEGSADILEIEATLVNSPKDLLRAFNNQLRLDFRLANIEQSSIQEGSKVSEDVTFDDREGPVVVLRDSKLSDSMIKGPAFIGNNVTVLGSDIDNSIIGDDSKIIDSVVRNSIIMDHVTIHGGCYISNSIIGSFSKVMPLACLCGERISQYEWKRGGEFVIVGDYCTIGPGAIVYPGVNIGAFSAIHGNCEEDVKSFELATGTIRRKLTLKEVMKLAQIRSREVNKFISDYELSSIKRLYEELL